MANRLISPSLADLSQDIAGVIPLDIILKWASGDKSRNRHLKLLQPQKIKGTVVSSDSAGLSKLSGSKTLAEVMQLVHQPKEVVYSYGSAIGGRGIGVWAADNSQMFYDDSIPVEEILSQMICAQNEIKALSVQIGLGIHTATFFEIGGGLFGEHAELVESLAENHTKGGDIVITKEVRAKLQKKLREFIEKKRIDTFEHPSFRLFYDSLSHTGKKQKDARYPCPFTNDFYDFLEEWDSTTGQKNLDVFRKYASEQIVILVKVHHKKRDYLLDELTDWMLANTIMKKMTVLEHITEVKSNGSLGIYVTSDPVQALEFAVDVRDTMQASNYTVSIGISKGEVLLFPFETGGMEIAGGAVNIASKLAEDVQVKNSILLEASALSSKMKKPSDQTFSYTLSGVTINGYTIV